MYRVIFIRAHRDTYHACSQVPQNYIGEQKTPWLIYYYLREYNNNNKNNNSDKITYDFSE